MDNATAPPINPAIHNAEAIFRCIIGWFPKLKIKPQVQYHLKYGKWQADLDHSWDILRSQMGPYPVMKTTGLRQTLKLFPIQDGKVRLIGLRSLKSPPLRSKWHPISGRIPVAAITSTIAGLFNSCSLGDLDDSVGDHVKGIEVELEVERPEHFDRFNRFMERYAVENGMTDRDRVNILDE